MLEFYTVHCIAAMSILSDPPENGANQIMGARLGVSRCVRFFTDISQLLCIAAWDFVQTDKLGYPGHHSVSVGGAGKHKNTKHERLRSYCFKIDRTDKLNTDTGMRTYVLLSGTMTNDRGESGSHVDLGMVGALVIGKGQNEVEIITGDPLMPIGAFDTVPTKWDFIKLGPSDYWGWQNTWGMHIKESVEAATASLHLTANVSVNWLTLPRVIVMKAIAMKKAVARLQTTTAP